MLKGLIIIMLSGILSANNVDNARYARELVGITYDQKVVLIKAYMAGTEYDLGFTMAAIAWKESNLGKYVVNLNDGYGYKFKGSYGIYHNLLQSVCDRAGVKTQWSASRLAERLIRDEHFAGEESIKELLFWQRVWKNRGVSDVYRRTVGSYNAGGKSIECDAGNKYMEDIVVRVKLIQKYFSKYNIIEVLK